MKIQDLAEQKTIFDMNLFSAVTPLDVIHYIQKEKRQAKNLM